MSAIKTPAYRRIVFTALCVFALIANVILLLGLVLLFREYRFLIGVAAGWLVLGVIGYALILWFLSPTPLVMKIQPLEEPESESFGRPFSVRDLLGLFVAMFGVSLAGPFWLIVVAFGLTLRNRTNRQWNQLFPNASKAEIREFLEVLFRSFDEPLPENYRLSPSDKLIRAYRAIYGPDTAPDKTEIENLANQLAQRYGVEVLNSLREDTTVGELFALIQRH
ncbi:MAG TPA: hypothetical protein VGY56_00025 [Verrucomicrobiae bacterium]|nr:hypothetical protein [Verrucomicrobiae bacterium]